jgi:hypothetical protein
MINSHASASVEKDRLRHKTWYKQNSFLSSQIFFFLEQQDEHDVR